jgi:AcrR family transcriptional regulator
MGKRAPKRGQYDRDQSPEQRRAETRQRILVGVMEVVTLRGLADASVDQVVRAAGISRRTFYEHFKDLAQALVDVHQETSNALFHVVQDAVRNAHDDPAACIRAGIEAFFQAIAANAEFARLALQQFRGTPEHEALRELAHGRYIALFMQEVAKDHARGVASRPPDELTVYALVTGMEAVAMRYVARRDEGRLMEAVAPMLELMVRAFI